MRYFCIHSEDAPQGTRPFAWVEGRHRWMLPNRIGCPDCTIYTATGPAYPSIDLSGWPDADALTEPAGVSWRQFRELVERLRPLVGPDVLLAPGAELGPFVGMVRGAPCDFVHGPIHLLFATPAACARLGAVGIALPPTVPAQLRARGPAPVDFLEFDVPCEGRLAPAGYTHRAPEPCDTCGRWDRSLERVVLEEASTLATSDLVRPLNHPTLLLASERFVDAVWSAELTGLAFEPVEVVAADT